MKIGDTVIYTVEKTDTLLLGTVVAMGRLDGENFISVRVEFDFMPGQSFEVSIDKIIDPENYTGVHHALLLGITP